MTESLTLGRPAAPQPRIERDELVILNELVPLEAQSIVELGCGNARLARQLLERFPRCRVTGLEVDTVQHA
ncbi:MAG TPA: class I SAM-dependent methyltransferase, partial [Ottowia sp.]|nr:class I SAM-dependent methyltransferase [Ottowia sp.]